MAFLRNVNLGQPRSPTRDQLEGAFFQAGADAAASFMTNGTLVFSVSRSRLASSTARRARKILGQVCGLQEPIFVQSFGDLAELAAEDPFAPFTTAAVGERFISFFEPKATARLALPLESERQDCLVFRASAGLALSIIREVKGKTGYPNLVLQDSLGTPVTTRSWTTILRLVKRHA